MTGERALGLWEASKKALKDGDLARAEEIAVQMHMPSDAKLLREAIEKQRAATLCGSSGPIGKEPAAHQPKEAT